MTLPKTRSPWSRTMGSVSSLTVVLLCNLTIALTTHPANAQPQQIHAPPIAVEKQGQVTNTERLQQLWAAASPKLRKNLYAPLGIRAASAKSSLDGALSVRAALNSRISGNERELNSYLAEDVLRRREVLAFLLSTSKPLKRSDAYLTNVRSVDRKFSLLERTYLLKASGISIAKVGTQPIHLKSLCLVNFGLVMCGSDFSLITAPVAGYWTRHSTWISVQNEPSTSWDILHLLESLEDISEQLGLADVRANTAVICGGSGAFLVQTKGPAVVPGQPISQTLDVHGIATAADPSLPSNGEMRGMVDGCRIIDAGTRKGGGASGIPQTGSGIGQDAVNDAVGSIDDLIGKCQGSLISGSVSAGWDDVIRLLFGVTIKGVLWQTATGVGGLLGLASDEPVDWRERMDAASAEVHARKAEEEASVAAEQANQASESAKVLEHEAEMAEAYAQRAESEAKKAASASAADPNNAVLAARSARLAEVAKNTRKAADEAKQAADKAQEDAVKQAAEADEKKREAERKRKEAEEKKKKLKASGGSGQQNSSGGTSSYGSEEFGLTTCEQLKNSWNRFKSECERAESWDRPGTDCNDVVRNQLGCVDIRLIQPTPDDLTMTCHRGDLPHVDVCEKQQWVAGKW